MNIRCEDVKALGNESSARLWRCSMRIYPLPLPTLYLSRQVPTN